MAMPDLRRHLIFDLTRHMHLPTYLQYLLEFWRRQGGPGELYLLLWPSIPRSYPEVVRLAAEAPDRNVHILTPTRQERDRKVALGAADTGLSITLAELLRDGSTARYAALYDWELLERHAAAVGATHCTVLFMDTYLPLLAGGVGTPVSLSGIYFHPTFHYGDFANHPAPAAAEAAQGVRERFVLARALRDPGLRTLFFLDPFAAARAAAVAPDKVRFLPDPVRLPAADPARVTALRGELGLLPGRRVFLLFGNLTRRKGAWEVLWAVRLLPDELARRSCLAFVGTTHPDSEADLLAAVADARARTPAQVVTHLGYVPHDDVPAYFRLADVVLATYPRHAGMSGVLLLAAAAGRPVLASSYGLMGELTRRRGLGLAVEAASPEALAGGLRRFLVEDPASLCDPHEQARLAREHEADHFAAALLHGPDD
jgi:glycosyltransferase involved in cell wall biosynthesis